MSVCSKLLAYNLVDCEGLVLLNETFNLIEDQFEQAHLVLAPPADGIYSSKMHDHDMIRDYRNTMVFDTKWQEWKRPPLKPKDQIGDKFTLTLKSLEEQAQRGGKPIKYKSLADVGKVGGYVQPPIKAGTYTWVAKLDFEKQYPNAIISTNAGIRTAIQLGEVYPDKVVDKFGVVWNKKELIETPIAFFRKDIESVNKKKFKKWLKLRKESQKISNEYLAKVANQEDPFWILLDGKQFRVKTFTNGGFGVMGLKQDRNYSEITFDACTLTCQDLTMKMILILTILEYIILGGDTDSCFVVLKSNNLDDAIKECESLTREINKQINDYLNEVYNIQEHTMEVGVETISDKFLIKAAKNYVQRNVWMKGVRLSVPQLEVKGIEMKKSNTSVVAADMQEVLVNILLDSNNIEKDFSTLINALDKEFKNLPWEYLAPRGRIANNLTDYQEGNYNARGARNAQTYLNKVINTGDNPFVLSFKVFPKIVNNHYVSVYKGESFVLSFDEEDIPNLKEIGFVPDFEDLKRSQIHLKAEPWLNLVDVDYYSIKARKMISSDMIL